MAEEVVDGFPWFKKKWHKINILPLPVSNGHPSGTEKDIDVRSLAAFSFHIVPSSNFSNHATECAHGNSGIQYRIPLSKESNTAKW